MAALADGDATRRGTAAARLRVLGSRALERLAAVATSDADPSRRRAALECIEGIDDVRGIEAARTALADPDTDVRVAAVAVLRGWLTRETGAAVFETLSAIAVAGEQDARLRRACLDALSDLPPHLIEPLRAEAMIEAGSDPHLDDPGSLRDWLAAHGDASLSQLHALVMRARELEVADASPPRRRDWLAARGAVHAVLARRGSGVALYDLRETFEAAHEPLPLDFLAAATTIGDHTCLEPLARAWAAAPATEAWWRDRLAATATEIMHRSRLSARGALVKRLRGRWPGFL